jgi:hypothetical protein
MNTVQTIYRKLSHLPPPAQEEVLAAIESIEERYADDDLSDNTNGNGPYPLAAIAELAMDMGISDLAERHDFYAHGKLEE